MANEAPPFWWGKPDWRAALLAPLAAIYGAVASRRLRKALPPHIAAPVLCVGNFTVGGAGKTPTCIALAKAAKNLGLQPGIISRGYGGTFSGVHLVNLQQDSAKLTGDEPLLLAAHAPVAVSPDRLASARLLLKQGCDFIIMDDGFQSARLQTDYALLVVDAARGIGNGKVIPAGPLRAPLLVQVQKATAVLKLGSQDAADKVVRQAARGNKQVFTAGLRSLCNQPVADRKFLAFAGIGHPQKFFDSIQSLNGIVVQERPFGDHYVYTVQDMQQLLQEAQDKKLILATTAKDYVRLVALANLGVVAPTSDWLDQIAVFDIELDFGRDNVLERIITQTRQNYLERSLS